MIGDSQHRVLFVGPVVVGNGPCVVLQAELGVATVLVSPCITWVEFDGPVVVGNGPGIVL